MSAATVSAVADPAVPPADGSHSSRYTTPSVRPLGAGAAAAVGVVAVAVPAAMLAAPAFTKQMLRLNPVTVLVWVMAFRSTRYAFPAIVNVVVGCDPVRAASKTAEAAASKGFQPESSSQYHPGTRPAIATQAAP